MHIALCPSLSVHGMSQVPGAGSLPAHSPVAVQERYILLLLYYSPMLFPAKGAHTPQPGSSVLSRACAALSALYRGQQWRRDCHPAWIPDLGPSCQAGLVSGQPAAAAEAARLQQEILALTRHLPDSPAPQKKDESHTGTPGPCIARHSAG